MCLIYNNAVLLYWIKYNVTRKNRRFQNLEKIVDFKISKKSSISKFEKISKKSSISKFEKISKKSSISKFRKNLEKNRRFQNFEKISKKSSISKS